MAACERVYSHNENAAAERVVQTEVPTSTNQNILSTAPISNGKNNSKSWNLRLMLADYLNQRKILARAKSLLKSLDLDEIDGVWSDNWIGPICRIHLKNLLFGEHIHLTGIPTLDMELTVAVNNKPIGVFPLRDQQLEEIRFPVKPGRQLDLLLYFSGYKVDTAGRKLSFMLQGSNLFSERDLQELVA
jgi:hypothetical protein